MTTIDHTEHTTCEDCGQRAEFTWHSGPATAGGIEVSFGQCTHHAINGGDPQYDNGYLTVNYSVRPARIPDYAWPTDYDECESDTNPAIGINHGPDLPHTYELFMPICAECMDRAAECDWSPTDANGRTHPDAYWEASDY